MQMTKKRPWLTTTRGDWYPADNTMRMYRFEHHLMSGQTVVAPDFFEYIKHHLNDPSRDTEASIIMHPEDISKIKRLEDVVVSRVKKRFCLKIRLRIPPDPYRSYPCIAQFKADESGTVCRVAGFILCIRNYWHLQSQAIHLEKAINIATLAAGAVHDTKNHLHIVENSLSLLGGMIHDDHSIKLVQMAREANTEANTILEQVLDYTRETPPQFRRIDLNDLLSKTVQSFTFLFSARYTLVFNACPDACQIKGDPTAIRNILVNLIINARDAMPRGGTLTFTVSRTASNSAWHGDPKKSWIIISVKDTGSGMGPEVIAQAFHPFYTTKGAGRGTGMGLWMCRTAMTKHEGTITIRSRQGEGTEILLAFPDAGQPVASAL